MEAHAFGFRLPANALEGQKRFPISFSNPAFGLQELAAALLLSLYHLYRKVKALTGLLLATSCTPA
jgi:hypothetical protein